MTRRSELSHRLGETKARLQTRVAARLFSTRGSRVDRWLNRLLKAEQDTPYSDPDLEHPVQR